MTTEVTIKKSNATNEMDLMVTELGSDGEVGSKHRVKDGAEVAISVFDGQDLLITEVEKEVAETAEGEDLADPDKYDTVEEQQTS